MTGSTGEAGPPDVTAEVAGYRPLLFSIAYGMTGSVGDAEDIVQEAFAKALSHAGRFWTVDNPEAWLRTVAINLLRSRWRRALRWRRLMPSLPGTTADVELSADHLALVEALRKIAPGLREVVVLHYLADLPVLEIAAALGVPEGTVKSRLMRGREALAALLGNEEER